MKFFMVIDVEPSKLADVAAASDKIWSNPPKGVKKLAQYALLAPVPAHDLDRVRVLALLDAENEQALVSIGYAVGLAGARLSAIPVCEYGVAPELAKLEQELRSQVPKG
jgi:hypothetical protein